MQRVSFLNFYNEYHGHRKQDLELLLKNMRTIKATTNSNIKHSFVYVVGDSSFDNKYWLNGAQEKACNGYEEVLDKPKAVPDIAHCMNQFFERHRQENIIGVQTSNQQQQQHYYTVINCAVEESTIGRREDGKLLPQDEFVRDNVSEDDIICSSLLGNDIALSPTKSTIASMAWLTKLSSTENIRNGSAWGLGHFRTLAHDHYEAYLNNLTSKTKPKMIIPCMIYHLDENKNAQSWANRTLELIGYDTTPSHIQAIIHRVFLDCMKNNPYKVAGVKHIFPIELSKALDGKDTRDYDNRVEPSVVGGRKMAKFIFDNIIEQVRRLDIGEVGTDRANSDAAVRSEDDDDDDDSNCFKKKVNKISKKN